MGGAGNNGALIVGMEEFNFEQSRRRTPLTLAAFDPCGL